MASPEVNKVEILAVFRVVDDARIAHTGAARPDDVIQRDGDVVGGSATLLRPDDAAHVNVVEFRLQRRQFAVRRRRNRVHVTLTPQRARLTI